MPSCVDVAPQEVLKEAEGLCKVWANIMKTNLHDMTPRLIYSESNVIKRSLRAMFSSTLTDIVVDGATAFRQVENYIKYIAFNFKNVVEYKGKIPIMEFYKVEEAINALYMPRVDLASGGYIIISYTPAFTTIDVNSGSAVGYESQEETALNINLEAAEAITRHIRLRDIGGIIVIDFIDLATTESRKKLEMLMYKYTCNDKAHIQCSKLSKFCLMEVCRQKLRNGIADSDFVPCNDCGGIGITRNGTSMLYPIISAIGKFVRSHSSYKKVEVNVNAAIGLFLLNEGRKIVDLVMKNLEIEIFININPAFKTNDYKISSAQRHIMQVKNIPMTSVRRVLESNIWRWVSIVLSILLIISIYTIAVLYFS